MGLDCEIIAWDLRGLGKSSKPPSNDYSLEAMAGDLHAIISEYRDRPVILLGHSIGGMICQTSCRLFPAELNGRVTQIVLCDTTYTNPLHTVLLAPLWRALQKPLIEPLLHLTIALSPFVWLMNLQSYFNGSTHYMTRFSSFAGKQTWGQIDLASRLSSFASPAVVARGMLAMLRHDETKTLPHIHVPTTVLMGSNDRLTRPFAGEYIANQIPQAKFVDVAPGGHLSILERHEVVNQTIANCVQAQLEVQLQKVAG